MANPFYGILLNNKYYHYEPGSYKVTTPLKNSSEDTQNSRIFNIQGKAFDMHSITITLRNSYFTFSGNSNIQSTGETTWLGISRLIDLKNDLGALGASLPITFVDPSGITHSVVATGSIDQELINPVQPSGTEWRVNLTLEDYS